MTRILVIGYAPEAVDFSDPALPPGLDAGKIAAGLKRDLEKMRARGWEPEHLPIHPDETIRDKIVERLRAGRYDCIVIGGGVRLARGKEPFLEVVVNAIREGAPHTPIAFNNGPDTSGEAAARWVGAASPSP